MYAEFNTYMYILYVSMYMDVYSYIWRSSMFFLTNDKSTGIISQL